MKRISVAILCLLMAYVSVTAAPITRAQAQQKAAAFMVNRGWVSQESVNNIQQPHRAASAQQRQLTYVFNAPDNKGYVILSGDDCTEPVIGYGEGGSFDEATMPENMKGWLVNIEEEIQWLQDNNVQMTYVNKIPTHDAIAPLLTSKWGQDAPYNGLCPSGCPSGCLATAVAQVMYYHKWPEQTLEAIPGYTTYTTKKKLNSLPVTTFDWASMKDTYNGGTSNAVAKLMQYIGYAVEMDYAPDGSGASERNLPSLLQQYFNYSKSTTLAYRDYYSIETWDNLIYNELVNNRPVVYCGASMGGGHAFVCDGYDGNGLYHINWGWDGYYNNYFRLSVLNPGTTTATGSSEVPDGYTMYQSVVFGMKKPESTDESVLSLQLSSISSSGTTITIKARGYSYDYYLGLALLHEDGSFDVKSSTKVTPNSFTKEGNGRFTFANLGISNAGSYVLVPVYRLNEGDDFHRFDLTTHYVEAIVSSGSSVEFINHPIIDLSADNIHFTGDVGLNKMTQIDFQLNNQGDEYNGMLYLFDGTTSTSGRVTTQTPVAYANVAIEKGETQDLSFWFMPTKLEDNTLTIATDAGNNNIIGSYVLESYRLEGVSQQVSYNPLSVTVTIKNNSSNDYNNAFVAYLYQKGKTKAIGTVRKTQTITSGGTTTYVYDTFNLSASNTYTMKFAYMKNDYSSTLMDLDMEVLIDWVTPTTIEEVELNANGGTWYTPSGMQISQPTAKGIYIRDGKKFVK